MPSIVVATYIFIYVIFITPTSPRLGDYSPIDVNNPTPTNWVMNNTPAPTPPTLEPLSYWGQSPNTTGEKINPTNLNQYATPQIGTGWSSTVNNGAAINIETNSQGRVVKQEIIPYTP